MAHGMNEPGKGQWREVPLELPDQKALWKTYCSSSQEVICEGLIITLLGRLFLHAENLIRIYEYNYFEGTSGYVFLLIQR